MRLRIALLFIVRGRSAKKRKEKKEDATEQKLARASKKRIFSYDTKCTFFLCSNELLKKKP